ncbi:MAG TPA: dihydropyrimidine dehydrogenase, partial [Roseburia sp.]|nr:dihydropyrimidine dehydrogenase [Roseburia sp.]
VTGIRLIKMQLGEPDASGRRRPEPIEGSEYEVSCDTVIMALGTTPNPLISSTTTGLDVNKKKCLIATEDGATTKEGVYAGGDAVTGAATVILAMGAGKVGAASIDQFIKSKEA